MNAREIIGLLFVIAGVAMVPFAYWAGFGWGLLALVPAVPGFALLLSARRARLSTPDAHQPDSPPGHDLQGFHGAAVLGSHGAADVADADGGS